MNGARMISEELKLEARRAFVAYEKVFIERIAQKPGWRLDASNLEKVLATGDEARIRAYIEDLEVTRRDIERAVVV